MWERFSFGGQVFLNTGGVQRSQEENNSNVETVKAAFISCQAEGESPGSPG